jgi:hypothetical protein
MNTHKVDQGTWELYRGCQDPDLGSIFNISQEFYKIQSCKFIKSQTFPTKSADKILYTCVECDEGVRGYIVRSVLYAGWKWNKKYTNRTRGDGNVDKGYANDVLVCDHHCVRTNPDSWEQIINNFIKFPSMNQYRFNSKRTIMQLHTPTTLTTLNSQNYSSWVCK